MKLITLLQTHTTLSPPFSLQFPTTHSSLPHKPVTPSSNSNSFLLRRRRRRSLHSHTQKHPNFKLIGGVVGGGSVKEERDCSEPDEDAEFPVVTCITRTLPPALTLEHGLRNIKESVDELKSYPPNSASGMYRFQVAVPSSVLHLSSTTTTSRRNVAVSAQLPSNNNNSSSSSSSYSISDSDLESRGFNLRRSISDLNITHLNAVFVAVGFPRRDPDKIRLALEHTDSILWVEYEKTKRPVAFARATGDGVFNAIIWDVVVDPSFQGIGLGKAVMERLVTELLMKGIMNIALYSEPRVLGFYRPLGFVADPDGIRGMVYSRKQKKKK